MGFLVFFLEDVAIFSDDDADSAPDDYVKLVVGFVALAEDVSAEGEGFKFDVFGDLRVRGEG